MTTPDLEQTGVGIFFGALLISVGLVLWDVYDAKNESLSHKIGGVPERFGVITFLYMLVVQALGYSGESAGPEYGIVDQISVLSDLLGLVGFLALAINARRFWPLFCTALQACSLIFHYARDILPNIIPLAYSIQKSTPTTLALLIVLGALISRRWRVNRDGWDVDWSAPGYWQIYRETNNRALLWNYIKTYGRSWLGLPVMIWGVLVFAYCMLSLWTDSPFSVPLALLGAGTVGAGFWYHRQENILSEDRARAFNNMYDERA